MKHKPEGRQVYQKETELEFLQRFYYISRELIGHIKAGGVPDDDGRFFESITRMIDEYVDRSRNGGFAK